MRRRKKGGCNGFSVIELTRTAKLKGCSLYEYDPKFVMFTGPMFGSKTTRLLAAVERLRYQSRTVVVFKPKFDSRGKRNKVETHSGISTNAVSVDTGQQIIKACSDTQVDAVAVDEAFMIPGVGEALISLFKRGKTVLVSSIQLSSSGQAFEETKVMFPWATHIEVCPAVCSITGKDAYYTHRKVPSDNLVEVGGSEKYEPRCWAASEIFPRV